MGKWQCEIKYYDEVPENAIKQIEIQEKKNNNEKVYLFDMGCPHLAFHFV